MTNINSHIEDYLDYYCSLQYPPEYAVLLKGSWGAGKTWFVKKYCDKLKSHEQKYLYVSLYGMTTFAEIEDAFFQQLHPILSSKGMAITGKILKGLVRTTLKIDLDGDKKEDMTLGSQVPDINLPDYLRNSENCILVFDDLERCALSIESILGYINHFTEHQEAKVIIVANEDEIFKSEINQKETERSYKRIKEKLIGKTFKVAADLDGALDVFLQNVTDIDARACLQSNIEVVKYLYSAAGYDNLRHLKQAIWDFERLFKALPQEAVSKAPLVLHLLKILLLFSFEIKHGTIQPSDINNVRTELSLRLIRHKEKEPTMLSEVISKYKGIDLYDLLLTDQCWLDFFDKGVVDETSIKEALLKSRYYQNETTAAWVKLWHFVDLTDDEFIALLNEVTTEYSSRQYQDIGVVKHVTGLFLEISSHGLYAKTHKDILKEGIKYVDFLKEKGALIISRSWFDPDSYGGLGFYGKDLPEFKRFIGYIERKTKEAKTDSMPKAGDALLQIMTDDISQFYRMICLCNSSDQVYFQTPIFSHISSKLFVDKFLALDPENRRTVLYALEKRYEFDNINRVLVTELPWLKKMRRYLIAEQRRRKGKLSGYLAKSAIEYYLNNFIKKLEDVETAVKQEERGAAPQ